MANDLDSSVDNIFESIEKCCEPKTNVIVEKYA